MLFCFACILYILFWLPFFTQHFVFVIQLKFIASLCLHCHFCTPLNRYNNTVCLSILYLMDNSIVFVFFYYKQCCSTCVTVSLWFISWSGITRLNDDCKWSTLLGNAQLCLKVSKPIFTAISSEWELLFTPHPCWHFVFLNF